MEFEQWKKIEVINSPRIKGKPIGDYEVSNYGNLRQIISENLRRNVLLDTSSDIRPRFSLVLEDGKRHKVFIHQLVAQAFIPNPEGYPNVRHINGDKANNYVGNLQWTN